MDDTNGNDSFDFDKLQLKSPFMEFEDFVRSKVSTAERLGDRQQVELYLQAFELGKRLLSRKIGGLHDS